MKNKLLSLILLGMAISSFGQITITNNNIAAEGTSVYLANDTVSISIVPGDAGPNKTWDFSNLVANTIDTMDFISPSSTPYAGNFPGANLAFSGAQEEVGNAYGFMIKNDDKYSSVGFAIEVGDTATYLQYVVPEDIILDFPVNYQNTYNEVYFTDMIIESPMPEADSMRTKSTIVKETTIDAWGTITIPTGTYDALRQCVTEDQTDSTFMKMGGVWMFIVASEYTTTTYSWWTDDSNIDFMLLSIDVDNDFGDEVYGISYYAGSVVGLNETKMAQTKVFPNPATDIVNFEFDASFTGELMVMNDMGHIVIKKSLNDQKFTQLSLSQLVSGMYIYRIMNNSGTLLSSGKLQKH